MKKTTMIAAATLCCWSSFSAAEEFHFVHFKDIAKKESAAPNVAGKPRTEPAPERTGRSAAIRTGCAHLALGDFGCKQDCIAGERDGRYFDVWCQYFQDGPTPGGKDWSLVTCDATVYVDMASGAILPAVQGDNRSWTTSDAFTCRTEHHPAPSGGWSPIPF